MRMTRAATPVIRSLLILVSTLAAAGATAWPLAERSAANPSPRPAPNPIQHVVVLYQENHSFDNLLGKLCVLDARCDGATTGRLADGSTIHLAKAADLVPSVGHTTNAQTAAVDGGRMDGFSTIEGCTWADRYRCYSQFVPNQIPNLALLARAYTISDRTFEMDAIPSWGAHLELVAAQLDGFSGDNPNGVPGQPHGPGWGCDSLKDTLWRPRSGARYRNVPSCVPAPDGSGPYRHSPVPWVPSIMDRLDGAGLSWHIYTAGSSDFGYGWAICPTFAECLDGPQFANVEPSEQVITDAQAGQLPSVSLVLPTAANSQHNGNSMLTGDNWIGSVVSAIMGGPDWSSSAVFIAYDDCGCFSDHVSPPPGLGIRVPMVIVSPYARSGFTDSTTASFPSMLAFIEHTFGLQPLSTADAGAYDYSGSFNLAQRPLPGTPLSSHLVPRAELRWIASHRPREDGT
jgi:phospholipase C